jgi:G:T-mismatch repair DNA endonuclease (very short patch repair protein)
MNCIICGQTHDGSYGKSGKYCSKKCRYTFTPDHKRKISASLTGVEKPYLLGENNPNFGRKCIRNLEVYKKFRESVKARGQGWNDSIMKKHSVTMSGESNWMRGRHHTEETKQKIREKILSDLASGKRKPTRTMVSMPEKEIAAYLCSMGYNVRMGFRVENKLYDIFVPDKMLIIEFNGDYWHMNPKKYLSSDYNKTAHMTADEIWNRDKNKKHIAIKNGYGICYIWEDDYKRAEDKIDFLKSIIP